MPAYYALHPYREPLATGWTSPARLFFYGAACVRANRQKQDVKDLGQQAAFHLSSLLLGSQADSSWFFKLLVSSAAWLDDLGLNDKDREVLLSVLSVDQQVNGVAPRLDGNEIVDALSCSLRIYANIKRAQESLKRIIGQLLIDIEEYPEIYRSRGFERYDDFLRHLAVLFGVPRSECYRAKRLAAAWPSLTPAEFSQIGTSKLYDLSRFTGSSDPKAEYWLDVARTNTQDELRDKIAQSGEVPKEIMVPAVLSINTCIDIKLSWLEFANNPDVQAMVGSTNHGDILAAAIGEARSSWGI